MRAVGVETREVDGELVVVDEPRGLAFSLNNVASYVWDGLASGVDESTLIDELAAAFGAPTEMIAADVAKVVEQFVMFEVMSIDAPSTIGADDDHPPPEEVILSLSLDDAPDFDDRYLAAPPNY